MKRKIISAIRNTAQEAERPDGTIYLRLSHGDEVHIAQNFSVSLKDVQRLALEEHIVPERYCRNQRTLSCSDQIALLESHVTVIGLGGLGGTVTEIMSRTGIGTLTLVDGDVFDESNLNRQLLSLTENIGMKKALIAEQRVQAINPAIDTRSICEFFTDENSQRILADTDLVVDCLDTITGRLALEKTCQELEKPLVSAAIGGSAGQVTVIFPGDQTLHTLYGNRPETSNKGIEKSQGTLAYAAVLMAAIECAEAVSLLISQPASLKDKLLLVELSETQFEKLSVRGNF